MTNEETLEEMREAGSVLQEEVVEEEIPVDEEDFEEPLRLEDIEDDNEELFPGGPSIGQSKAWKKEFGKLYVTSIDADTHIVWRPINRFEYKNHVRRMEQLNAQGNLSQAMISMKNEESLAAIAMLFPAFDPANPDAGLAGIPSLIAQEIMDASGFVAMSVKEL
jgi:hypothetical protein